MQQSQYPDVQTEYISTNNYSVQEHVRLLEQAIATKPDGIAVPIVDTDAFEGPLRKAIDMGIPVGEHKGTIALIDSPMRATSALILLRTRKLGLMGMCIPLPSSGLLSLYPN